MCVDCGTREPAQHSKSRCVKCLHLQAERTRRFKNKNRPKIYAAEKHRYQTDPAFRELKGEIARRWRGRNAEQVKASVKAYTAEKRQDPAWVATERERIRVKEARRRAQKLQSPGHFTKDEWMALCASFSWRCAYCGQEEKLTVDHAIPLSRGGSNMIDNIVPACHSCNSSKGSKTADEFCQSRL